MPPDLIDPRHYRKVRSQGNKTRLPLICEGGDQVGGCCRGSASGADLAILIAEIDYGLYKKPDEVLIREFRYEPLPPEIRTVIIAA